MRTANLEILLFGLSRIVFGCRQFPARCWFLSEFPQDDDRRGDNVAECDECKQEGKRQNLPVWTLHTIPKVKLEQLVGNVRLEDVADDEEWKQEGQSLKRKHSQVFGKV